jgi:hypothetical protein
MTASPDSDTSNLDSKKRRTFITFTGVILIVIAIGLIVIFTAQPLIRQLLPPEDSLTSAEYFSGAFAVLGGIIMFLLAFSLFPDLDRTRLALMLEMAGAGMGWILGMFFSPESQAEQQTFTTAKGAVVGLLSGYLLSKLQTAFDKAIRDGKLLNMNVLLFSLTFFIPMLITTAVVYSQRAYKDLSVKISKGEGQVTTDSSADGNTEYKLELSKKQHFIAVARFPTNSAVRWSLDPAKDHGCIEATTGEYSAPAEMPRDRKVDIVATSEGDKTKVGRLSLILQEPSK